MMNNNINNDNLQQFKEMISQIVRDEIQNYAKTNLETVKFGIITATDLANNTADVDLGASVAEGLINKTGLTLDTDLNVGDSVKVYLHGGSISNAYIGLKCGN